MSNLLKIPFSRLVTQYKDVKQFSTISASKLIYDKLVQHGVTDIVDYSGGAIMPFIDTLYNQNTINHYVNTHEQSGGHIATGYAKSSGKTGISFVTSGPGLTNSITPLLDATNDSTPLIVFSGQVPLKAMGTNAFQECPATEITKAVTKWNYCMTNPNEISDVIDHAFKVANNGKKGSVHVDLPKCVLLKNIDINHQVTIPQKFRYNNFVKERTFEETMTKETKRKIKKIANVINRSHKPVLYVGQGANHISHLIFELVNRAQIPITTTIHAMGVMDERHELSLEMLGMHGSAYANKAIQDADCIISIGTRFDDRTTGNLEKYAPEAYRSYKEGRGGIIHCNINPEEMTNVVTPHYCANMDSEHFVTELLKYIKPPNNKNRNDWISRVMNLKRTYPFFHIKAQEDKLKTQDVMICLDKYLEENNLKSNTFITTGVGNHQMMAAQFIKWTEPNRILTSGSLGVMGAGLPYAIGAQIANPDALVINLDGDSSFNHTGMELTTINKYKEKLPIKTIILNDGWQSMVRVWEELFFNKRHTATQCQGNPKYHKLAEAFNIPSFYCERLRYLPTTINQLLTTPGPALADIKTETDKCLPLVAPGKALDDMILHEEQLNDIDFSKYQPPS